MHRKSREMQPEKKTVTSLYPTSCYISVLTHPCIPVPWVFMQRNYCRSDSSEIYIEGKGIGILLATNGCHDPSLLVLTYTLLEEIGLSLK